jgi:uncharacterized protein YggE
MMNFWWLGFVVIAAPLVAQQAAINPPIPQIPEISVAARGEVRVIPDRATLQIGVQTRAVTAVIAAADNASKERAVFDALRALGLEPQQLSTTNYSVNPEQRYEPNKEPTIVGYSVSNTLLIDVKKISQIGAIIDAALAKGANIITSLQFYASTAEAARRTAITAAVEKARLDAEAAARAAGGSLGGLLEVSIGAYYAPPPRPVLMARAQVEGASTPETPINGGEQSVWVDVSTRWRFIPK